MNILFITDSEAGLARCLRLAQNFENKNTSCSYIVPPDMKAKDKAYIGCYVSDINKLCEILAEIFIAHGSDCVFIDADIAPENIGRVGKCGLTLYANNNEVCLSAPLGLVVYPRYDDSHSTLSKISSVIEDAIDLHNRKKHIKKDYVLGDYLAKNFINCTQAELDEILEARNSDFVRQQSVSNRVMNLPQFTLFIKYLRKSAEDSYWLVCTDDIKIGVISLTEINYAHASAFVGYYKIPAYSKRGAGVVMINMLQEIAFNGLKLRELVADCYDKNPASYISLEKSGFSMCGSTLASDDLTVRHYRKLNFNYK